MFGCLICLISSFVSEGKAEEDVCASIKASAHPEAPPAMWYDGKTMAGVGADAIVEIGKRIGVPIVLSYEGPWKRTLRALEIGEIDLIYALYKTEQRREIYDFTIPYFTDPVVIVRNPQYQSRIKSRKDLPYFKGAATMGDSFGNDIDNLIDTKLDVQRVRNYAILLKLIASDRVNYGIAPLWTIKGHIRRNAYHDEIAIVDNALAAENMYMAFSKNSPCRKYLSKINEELSKMMAAGDIDRLLDENIARWSK